MGFGKYLALMACATSLWAQDVDALFKDWAHDSSPGGAVAVVQNGEVVFAKGYGKANLEHGVPITADTVFPVASVSKQFTAMAVLLLERDGKLSLGDNIRKYLPELPDYGNQVSVRDLLQHTAGIRDQWEVLELSGGRMDDVLTHGHMLRLLFRQKELNITPGSRYLYSNGGYTLAAEIVARVSGKSFAEFCREAIFLPLAMKNTHFHDDIRRLVPNRADSYRRGRQGNWERAAYNYATVGPTGLETTVKDLVKWLDNFRTGRVGGPIVLTRMRQRTVLTDGSTVANGLGLGVAPMLGLGRVGHNGGDAGYRSSVSYLFGPAFGVAVLGNAAEFNASGIASSIASAFLNPNRERGESATSRIASPGSPSAIDLSMDALRQLEGAYRLAGGAIVDVRVGPDSRIEVSLPFRSYAPAITTAINRLWVQAELAQIEFPNGDPAIRIVQEYVRTGSLLRRGPAPTFQAADYAGRFESNEVETAYVISVSAGNLIISHIRRGDVSLRPLIADQFLDPEGILRELRFERDSRGKVLAFRAGDWRTPGVRFVRR